MGEGGAGEMSVFEKEMAGKKKKILYCIFLFIYFFLYIFFPNMTIPIALSIMMDTWITLSLLRIVLNEHLYARKYKV